MEPVGVWVTVPSVEEGRVGLSHGGGNESTGDNLQENVVRRVVRERRLTKNFMMMIQL